jgi:hypothetical protein
MRTLMVIAVFEVAIATSVAVLSPGAFNERLATLVMGFGIAIAMLWIAGWKDAANDVSAATKAEPVDEVASRRSRAA